MPPDRDKMKFFSEESGGLEKLAQRAGALRRSLKISRRELSDTIGVSNRTLVLWERRLPKRPNTDAERLWEQALGAPEGWLRNPAMAAELGSPASPSIDLSDLVNPSVAAEIRAIACWLSRPNHRRQYFQADMLTKEERRRADIFAERYGVLGEDCSTLQSIGVRYGLTRERIRQITKVMAERAFRLGARTPCLDRLIMEAEALLPCAVSTLNNKLRDVLGESLSISGADRFAREILGRNVVITHAAVGPANKNFSDTIAMADGGLDMPIIRAVREASTRMIRNCGAAQIAQVAGIASGVVGHGITPDEAHGVCILMTGFEWLQEKDGWFWFGPDVPAENRLLAITKKVLAAAQHRVDVEELAQALLRSRRERYGDKQTRLIAVEPPLSVVVAVLSKTPWIRTIQSNDFALTNSIVPEEVFGDVELSIYRTMAAAGGVISWRKLQQHLCRKGRGVKLISLRVMVDSSPILKQIDYGVLALRGWPIEPTALKKAIASVGGKSKAYGRIGKPSKGPIRYGTIFTEYKRQQGAISLPQAVSRHCDSGDYTLEGSDVTVRIAHYNDGKRCQLQQISRKLIAMGISVGDRIEVQIDPRERHIRVERTN